MFGGEQNYEYVDIKQGPIWGGKHMHFKQNLTILGEEPQTYKVVDEQILFGSFFYLSQTIILHNNYAENIWGVIADIGGLIEFLSIIIIHISFFANDRAVMKKMIKSLYFQNKDYCCPDSSHFDK